MSERELVRQVYTKRLCLILYFGLYRGQPEVVEYLLSFGLSKNVKNEISKEYPA